MNIIIHKLGGVSIDAPRGKEATMKRSMCPYSKRWKREVWLLCCDFCFDSSRMNKVENIIDAVEREYPKKSGQYLYTIAWHRVKPMLAA